MRFSCVFKSGEIKNISCVCFVQNGISVSQILEAPKLFKDLEF